MNNIYGGNFSELIDVNMIIGNGTNLLVAEKAGVAQLFGIGPNFIQHPRCIERRISFPRKHSIRSAHHIEKDTKVGFVAGDMCVSAPVLRAEAVGVIIARLTIVLSIY